MKNDWIVVGTDMDGFIGYQVVHRLDEYELRSGSYWGGIVQGLSLQRAEMQTLADELNQRNEPAPYNPYRKAL